MEARYDDAPVRAADAITKANLRAAGTAASSATLKAFSPALPVNNGSASKSKSDLAISR